MPNISQHIDIASFEAAWPASATKVAKLIKDYGFELRVVGGAVRDLIRGQKPRDIDFATDADPALLIWMFNQEGIECDSGGIAHGTVKAVFGDDDVVDVTCINYHIDPSNGRVKIEHDRDWKADALRRDLTINSLSVDLDGNLYDYTNGIQDIKTQRLRLNPGVDLKIRQDPNLILRWFRAMGYFANPNWPTRDFKMMQRMMPLLAKIRNDKRVQLGIAGIMSHPNSRKIIRLMCQAGASKYIDLDC